MTIVLLAMAPGTYANDMHRGPGYGYTFDDGHMMGRQVMRVDIPLTVTGTSDNMTTYTVGDLAMKGKKDTVATITLDKPLTGTYDTANNMGYMPTAGKDGMNIRIDTVNNGSLPVAGASGIISLQNIRTLYKDSDYSIMEFRKLVVHLPDGTVKPCSLGKPVKVIRSKDRKAVVTDANPGYTTALNSIFKGNLTFAANATPVAIKDLIGSEINATSFCMTGAGARPAGPPTA